MRRTTVSSIIHLWQKERRENLLKRIGRHAKLLEQSHKDALQSWIDENCSITLQELKNRLERQFSIVVSVATVSRTVSDFEYTYKAVTRFPKRRNDEQGLNNRGSYARQFMNFLATYDQEKLLFIDEVRFNVSMRARFGRFFRDTRSVHQVRNIRFRNISVCCAMTKLGIEKYKTQTAAFNRDIFSEFIAFLIVHINREHVGSSFVFVLDNVLFHQSVK
ncbi:hypothetical protein CDIK_3548 [Cucumispora dikerogammari]|nr:hypothetical protein CDIK_3548 [Cucumispora dikerogammari]